MNNLKDKIMVITFMALILMGIILCVEQSLAITIIGICCFILAGINMFCILKDDEHKSDNNNNEDENDNDGIV